MSSPCLVSSLPRADLKDKQYRILTVIVTGNGRNEAGDVDPVDMTELLDRPSYRTSKDSMQFFIRALVKHGDFDVVWHGLTGVGAGRKGSRIVAQDLLRS